MSRRTSMARACLVSVLGVTVVSATFCSMAAPAAAETNKVVADALFQEGLTLLQRKQWPAAKKAFEESHRYDPAATTLANIAECDENLGDLVGARSRLAEAVELGRLRKSRRLAAIEERLKYIEGRVPRLILRVAKLYPGLRITRNNLEVTTFGEAILVNPGSHRIHASAPGRVPISLAVEVRERVTVEIPIPELPEAPKPPEDAGADVTEAGPESAPDSGKPQVGPLGDGGARAQTIPSRVHTGLSITTLGLGLVGVGMGAFFGLQARSLYGDSGCVENVCATDEGIAKYRDAQSSARLSNILFIAGGALVAGGIVYLVIARSWSAPRLGIGPGTVQFSAGW